MQTWIKWSEFEIARLVVRRLQFMKLDCTLGQFVADVCVVPLIGQDDTLGLPGLVLILREELINGSLMSSWHAILHILHVMLVPISVGNFKKMQNYLILKRNTVECLLNTFGGRT